MNPQLKQMPLWRDANRLLLLIEEAVRQFPRYHKYTLGSDLRRQTMNICRLIARAVHIGFIRLGYNDAGSPTFGMACRWNASCSHAYLPLPVGEGRGAGVRIHTSAWVILRGYWSSSPYAANATNAWNVNLNNGNDNVNNKLRLLWLPSEMACLTMNQ